MSPSRRVQSLWLSGAIVVVVALSWRLNGMDVRAVVPFASVASAFDDPPGYPGYGWTRNGAPTTREEIVTAAGPDHCGWGLAMFLTIGWPPGTKAFNLSGTRLYGRSRARWSV